MFQMCYRHKWTKNLFRHQVNKDYVSISNFRRTCETSCQWALEETLNDAWIGTYIKYCGEVKEMLQLVKLVFQLAKDAGVLVPQLIPTEAIASLRMLMDDEAQEQAGVRPSNPYVFVTTSTPHCTHTVSQHCTLVQGYHALDDSSGGAEEEPVKYQQWNYQLVLKIGFIDYEVPVHIDSYVSEA